MTTPAIEAKDLRKTYVDRKSGRTKEALKGISLTVPRGAFYGLLGPNGAGKSTFINILAGLTVKTSGTMSVCGNDIDEAPREARQAIGVVPQELVLDPFFTPFEALENHAGYYGIAKGKRRTQEIIDAVGLTEQARTGARKLSGGMRRRLLVAKALVHTPDVLVLDEPTAGVDVELREQLWEYVRKLNRQGMTILLTTHYLEEAQELCDQIAVINRGELIMQDSKQAMLKLLDHKSVTITTAGTTTEIPEQLRAFDTSITPEGNITLRYRSTEYTFDDILRAVASSGIVIKDLSTQEADLEDIFRHLTREHKVA